MITLLAPEDGAVFSVMNDAQTGFVKRRRAGAPNDREYCDGEGRDSSSPAVAVFRWQTDDFEYPSSLEISPDPGFAGGAGVHVTPAHQDAATGEWLSAGYNFQTGKTYFWRVRQNGAFSAVRSFSTRPDEFRPIFVDNVRNFRDLGGRRNAAGRYVKQGMIYRGRFPEWREAERRGLTEYGKSAFVEELGIKTEIDLREEARGRFTVSPAGDVVRYVYAPFNAIYGGTFNEVGMGELRPILDVFFDPASYPVFFHCYDGADRTGFLAVLIDGILGMSDGDVALEYEFTSLFERRCWDELHDKDDYFGFLRERFGERPLYELIRLHLTDCGIDGEKLAAMRDFLIE